MGGGWHGLKGVLVCTGVKNMPAAPCMPNLGSIDIDGGEQDHQQVWPENTCQQFPNMQPGLPRVASLYSVTLSTADRSSECCYVPHALLSCSIFYQPLLVPDMLQVDIHWKVRVRAVLHAACAILCLARPCMACP